ncbi:MAG: hypothetical protein IPL39_16305 [Opitutaceae bacterium]|nr:hypothetical protein [Opitutaceae bacterium]
MQLPLTGAPWRPEVVLDDGRGIRHRVDGRIPKTKNERVVFVGAGYPSLPGARALSRESPEEKEVIEAIAEFVRRAPSEPATMLLNAITDR